MFWMNDNFSKHDMTTFPNSNLHSTWKPSDNNNDGSAPDGQKESRSPEASVEVPSTLKGALSLTNTGSAQFVHEALSLEDQPIRLVRVHPLRSDGIIHCSMKHTDPAKWMAYHPTGYRWPTPEEPYTCLSYIWGTDNPSHEILINERPLAIRRNLFDFLSNVARKANPAASYNDGSNCKDPVMYTEDEEFLRWWWIDALCIDQNSISEKNYQVQRMGNIYR